MILVLMVHRDEITVEKIIGVSSDNAALAILVLLVLFTIKGCTVGRNGSLLYVASGALFSLPLAVVVNMVESTIMTTIPFGLGKKGGSGTMEALTQRYKKLELLRSFPRKNPFKMTLLLRTLGLLPCEIVGMYLGACRLRYRDYICGTLLGLFPAAVAFSVMGAYFYAPTSIQFVCAAAFQVFTTVCTVIAGGIWKRKKKKEQGRVSKCSI